MGAPMAGVYPNIENLFLWARSEKIGYAEKKVMERWNNGMLDYWVRRIKILFYYALLNTPSACGGQIHLNSINHKVKLDPHPFFIPNFPFFQHSIIPLVIR
jgi:hypothetical protein